MTKNDLAILKTIKIVGYMTKKPIQAKKVR